MHIKGLDGLTVFGRNIPHRVNRSGKSLLRRSADFVVRSAKVRASRRFRWSASGKTAKSIGSRQVSKNRIDIYSDSRGARFQERGFKPHYVPIIYLSERAKKNIDTHFGGRKTKGKKGKKGFIYVTKHTPIFKPALELLDKKLDRWIDEEFNKIMR